MSPAWRARWGLRAGTPIPPIHAVDHNGVAACDSGLVPAGRPDGEDVPWTGSELFGCLVCKARIEGGLANPRRVQL